MENMLSRPGSRNASIRRRLHQCRMMLPNMAIVVGIWLLHQTDLGFNLAGLALVLGGTWDL